MSWSVHRGKLKKRAAEAKEEKARVIYPTFGLKRHSRLEHVMESTIAARENEGGARHSVERRVARRFAGHRTFLVGLLYVITTIAGAPSTARPRRNGGPRLAAVLGKVLIHLDARLFAPAVNPPGLVKGVDECFDFVAGLSQLLNGFAKLTRSGGVLVQ
jgi:hypothetical protein